MNDLQRATRAMTYLRAGAGAMNGFIADAHAPPRRAGVCDTHIFIADVNAPRSQGE